MVLPITDSSARTQLINRSLADFPVRLLEESRQEEHTRKTKKTKNKNRMLWKPISARKLKKRELRVSHNYEIESQNYENFSCPACNKFVALNTGEHQQYTTVLK